MAADEKSMPFIKHLASSDRKVRTQALTTLKTFLSASTTSRSLSHIEILKLWKGLFYSLWMCDRPIPQQNLCDELAGLLAALPDDAVAPWLAGFWETMSREWTGIDVYRMEKFLLLVRRVLGASLVWAREKKTTTTRQTRLGEVLEAWPFEGTGDLSKVTVGLRLHALDIWVDEVEKAGMLGEESTDTDEGFLGRIREMVEGQETSPSKPVRAKAKESLEDERLPWNTNLEKDEDMKQRDARDQDSWDGFDD